MERKLLIKVVLRLVAGVENTKEINNIVLVLIPKVRKSNSTLSVLYYQPLKCPIR